MMDHNRKPAARTVRINGISLRYYEWRGAPGNQQPPLIFAHATGFHGRAYDAVIDHFPDRRIVSIDLRGHGHSEGGPIDDWRTMSDDVNALLDMLNIRGAVGNRPFDGRAHAAAMRA